MFIIYVLGKRVEIKNSDKLKSTSMAFMGYSLA